MPPVGVGDFDRDYEFRRKPFARHYRFIDRYYRHHHYLHHHHHHHHIIEVNARCNCEIMYFDKFTYIFFCSNTCAIKRMCIAVLS